VAVTPDDAHLLIGIDLDGTIEDSRDDMVAAVTRVRRGFGLTERAAAQVRPHVNGGMDALYRACFDDYRPSDHERLATIQSAYEADYLANVAVTTRLYDGMREALVGLSQLGALACVTNKPERISRQLLAELGVGTLFATVVGGDSCLHGKPHRTMLETAAMRCGFERTPAVTIMIGDSNADIQLARAYDAKAVWCAWGYIAQPGDQPDWRARQPADLVAVCQQCVAGRTDAT
jgi:phosphoglycolate phosphatase-like HAD superfamily hydrolase